MKASNKHFFMPDLSFFQFDFCFNTINEKNGMDPGEGVCDKRWHNSTEPGQSEQTGCRCYKRGVGVTNGV